MNRNPPHPPENQPYTTQEASECQHFTGHKSGKCQRAAASGRAGRGRGRLHLTGCRLDDVARERKEEAFVTFVKDKGSETAQNWLRGSKVAIRAARASGDQVVLNRHATAIN